MDNISTALLTLSVANDNNWTSDGLPKVEVVSRILGEEVTRKEITNAFPGFTRQSAKDSEAKGDAEVTLPLDPESKAKVQAVPQEAPEDAACVEPEDDVVGMDAMDVFRDLDLVDRAIAEFSRQSMILNARNTAITAKLVDIGKRGALLDRQRDVLEKASGSNKDRDNINAYLAVQAKTREERAARARKFLEAGTTAADVGKALSGMSPLDAAMRARKPTPGTTRPAYPFSVQKS